jgi:O-antigen biosynthesis protein
MASSPDAPEPAPIALRDMRGELAAEFLRGSGIEIGALHLAIRMPPGASVRYVDRMTVLELRAHYPELAEWDLVPVDIVDDGEVLATIEDESVDFIIANHFLEHCEDPIRTIETHLRKLRPGGVLFYAVPDKRYTFDFRRPRTLLSHVVSDHENGPEASRSDHYLEWVQLVGSGRDAQELEAECYSIHFHVWTQADLVQLMLHCHERFGNFEIEAVRRHEIESIVVLRKDGELVVEEPTPAPAPAVEQPPPAAGPTPAEVARIGELGVRSPASSAPVTEPASPGGRLALSALRARLDVGSAASRWVVDPNGLPGRGLVMNVEAAVTLPLRLDSPVSFVSRARLLPLDWRDGRGAARVWVAVADDTGNRREVWTGTLEAAAELGKPEGLVVACKVPASTTELVLGVSATGPRRGPGRAVWLEPSLVDPSGPAVGRPTANSASVSTQVSSEGPLVSVLTPVHDPPLEMLEEAIESVRSQTVPYWELCLVDDGSKDSEVIAMLERYAAEDRRIHLTRREQAGGIASATNAAMAMATGEYIALLDHDDTLVPSAIERIAAKVAGDPGLDMIYSDEDTVLDGRPIWAHLKPAWSPDTLRTNGYTCHFGVYRRELVEEAGGFRSEFNGSQDVDMILRLVERTDRIANIPEILYHWRAHANSTAGGNVKPYAYVAARKAIAGHLERVGVDADVAFGPPGLYRVAHRVDPSVPVSLLIAVRDDDGLAEAARSWVAQPHEMWDVVLATPPPALTACVDALTGAGVGADRITTLPADPASDSVAWLAAAADSARGDHLLLMREPVAGRTHDWLTRLIGYSAQEHIGAAGPVVLGADGRITDAGVAIPDGIALHLLHGTRTSMDLHFGYGTSVYNVSAVSGVAITSRRVYLELGGLDRTHRDLALVDYCLRAVDRDLRIVTVPDSRLQLTGPDHAVNDIPGLWRLRETWSRRHTHDPYYNANFRTDRGDFALVSPL